MDLLAHSLAWPDTVLARVTAEGAKPVGPQETTGFFRHRSVAPQMSLEEFDATNASYMATLKARAPPREDRQALISRLSEEEIEAGLLQGWFSEEQMDAKHGKGHWRALPRHVI